MKKIRSRNFLRFVSVALSFGLMVGGLSVSADSTDAYGKEMLYEELQQWQPDYTEPEIISEDISKRGEFEKHFLRNDGSYVVASYPEPVHELVDGQWQEIDNTLSPENGRLENKADNFSTSFARSPGSGRMVSLGSQGHDLSWNIEAQALSPQIRSASSAVKIVPDPKVEAVIQEVTAPISQSETMADEDKMTVSKTASGIKYSDVLGDGVDIEYVVTPYKVKENVILRQAGNFVSYSMQMQTGGLKAVLKSNNTVELQDETGLVIYKIKTPYMYDADDEISYNIRVSVQQEGESCTITYIPDASWLHEEERVYPVVIDPTVISGQYASNYTYVDKDGSGMEVSFISGTERLASVHTGKTATENAISVSQGEGKQLAEAYVSPYIDLTEYEYEYRPDIYGHQYDSSRKLIHTHHYVRYINGYKTMDTVSVDLLEDGTLYAISMLYRDSFAHTSVPRIDQDKLQRVIDDYLSQLGISDYTVTSKVLIKNKDGETELYVVYDETDAAGDMFTIAIEAII